MGESKRNKDNETGICSFAVTTNRPGTTTSAISWGRPSLPMSRNVYAGPGSVVTTFRMPCKGQCPTGKTTDHEVITKWRTPSVRRDGRTNFQTSGTRVGSSIILTAGRQKRTHVAAISTNMLRTLLNVPCHKQIAPCWR